MLTIGLAVCRPRVPPGVIGKFWLGNPQQLHRPHRAKAVIEVHHPLGNLDLLFDQEDRLAEIEWVDVIQQVHPIGFPPGDNLTPEPSPKIPIPQIGVRLADQRIVAPVISQIKIVPPMRAVRAAVAPGQRPAFPLINAVPKRSQPRIELHIFVQRVRRLETEFVALTHDAASAQPV